MKVVCVGGVMHGKSVECDSDSFTVPIANPVPVVMDPPYRIEIDCFGQPRVVDPRRTFSQEVYRLKFVARSHREYFVFDGIDEQEAIRLIIELERVEHAPS